MNELQWEASLNFICEKAGYELRASQKEALERLHNGDDVVLVKMTGYRVSFCNSYKPFAINGRTNKSMNRRAIARGEYTHVWVSAEIVRGDPLVEGRFGAKRIKRTYNDGYCA